MNDIYIFAPEHRPDPAGWQLASAQDRVLICVTGCLCGDPDCTWTSSTYDTDWVSASLYSTWCEHCEETVPTYHDPVVCQAQAARHAAYLVFTPFTSEQLTVRLAR